LGISHDVAVDASGDVWIVSLPSKVVKFSSTGQPLSGTGFTGGGISTPFGIAIDGAGDAWVANNSSSNISEFSPGGAPLSPDSGFTDSNLNGSVADAIDASGNLWVANGFGDSVTEFVGVAAGVKTPLLGPAVSP
jgi:DNA-binding beta-propeller fold protein YncE